MSAITADQDRVTCPVCEGECDVTAPCAVCVRDGDDQPDEFQVGCPMCAGQGTVPRRNLLRAALAREDGSVDEDFVEAVVRVIQAACRLFADGCEVLGRKGVCHAN